MGDLTALVMQGANEPSQRLITNMWWLFAGLCVIAAIEVFTAAVFIRSKLRARKTVPAEPAIETLEEVA